MQTQNTPSALRESYNKYKQALETLDLFLVVYESKLPEGLGNLSLSLDGKVSYSVHLSFQADSEIARALLTMGQVFGREDWSALPDYSNRFFDWKKQLPATEVQLTIYGAQKIDQPQSFPVEPKCFPLQLEEGGEG